jgi:hypothetical protein
LSTRRSSRDDQISRARPRRRRPGALHGDPRFDGLVGAAAPHAARLRPTRARLRSDWGVRWRGACNMQATAQLLCLSVISAWAQVHQSNGNPSAELRQRYSPKAAQPSVW